MQHHASRSTDLTTECCQSLACGRTHAASHLLCTTNQCLSEIASAPCTHLFACMSGCAAARLRALLLRKRQCLHCPRRKGNRVTALTASTFTCGSQRRPRVPLAQLLSSCHLAVQAAQDAQAWQAATGDLAQQLQVVAQQQAQGSARLAAQVQGVHSSHLEAAAAATSLQAHVTGQAAQLAGLEAALATLQEQVQELQQQGLRQGQGGHQAEVQGLRAEVQTLASQVEQLQSEVEHPSSPVRGADVPRQLNTLQEQVRCGVARALRVIHGARIARGCSVLIARKHRFCVEH